VGNCNIGNVFTFCIPRPPDGPCGLFPCYCSRRTSWKQHSRPPTAPVVFPLFPLSPLLLLLLAKVSSLRYLGTALEGQSAYALFRQCSSLPLWRQRGSLRLQVHFLCPSPLFHMSWQNALAKSQLCARRPMRDSSILWISSASGRPTRGLGEQASRPNTLSGSCGVRDRE
jgi:hypothetical protein